MVSGKLLQREVMIQMKFGDKVIIRDGSRIDGCVGIIYRLEEEKAVVLLDKEVLWPVEKYNLEPVDKHS